MAGPVPVVSCLCRFYFLNTVPHIPHRLEHPAVPSPTGDLLASLRGRRSAGLPSGAPPFVPRKLTLPRYGRISARGYTPSLPLSEGEAGIQTHAG